MPSAIPRLGRFGSLPRHGARLHGFANRLTAIELGQQAASFGQGKENPDLPIDDARLHLRAGLPTRDRFFGRAEQRGEVALVQAER